LVAKKNEDFGDALQNLYQELERAEDLVGIAVLRSRFKKAGAKKSVFGL
jgi:hypothetical protein